MHQLAHQELDQQVAICRGLPPLVVGVVLVLQRTCERCLRRSCATQSEMSRAPRAGIAPVIGEKSRSWLSVSCRLYQPLSPRSNHRTPSSPMLGSNLSGVLSLASSNAAMMRFTSFLATVTSVQNKARCLFSSGRSGTLWNDPSSARAGTSAPAEHWIAGTRSSILLERAAVRASIGN